MKNSFGILSYYLKGIEEIQKINEMGSSYNLLGLFVPYSHRENIMFCSQFVYTALKSMGIAYFDKSLKK